MSQIGGETKKQDDTHLMDHYLINKSGFEPALETRHDYKHTSGAPKW